MNLDLAGNQCVWLPTPLEWPPGQVDIPTEAMRLIEDPNYCMQEKADGVHVVIARTKDKLISLNRKGEPHAIPQATANALMDLPPNTMLDGEKMFEGGLVVFDTMYVDDQDMRDLPYSTRLMALARQVLPRVDQKVIWLVETETEADRKLALLLRVKAERGEGIVIKDLRAKYVPGRPETGGTSRKLKFKKSVTVIVQRREAKDIKASFEVFVLDANGKPVNIGQVSAQQFFNQVEPGKARIAEISYLYSSPSNRLIQPVLVRPIPWRDDKSAEECTLDQLVRGGRFAGK